MVCEPSGWRPMMETAGPDSLAMLPGLAARMDALLAEGRHHDDLAVVGLRSVHVD